MPAGLAPVAQPRVADESRRNHRADLARGVDFSAEELPSRIPRCLAIQEGSKLLAKSSIERVAPNPARLNRPSPGHLSLSLSWRILADGARASSLPWRPGNTTSGWLARSPIPGLENALIRLHLSLQPTSARYRRHRGSRHDHFWQTVVSPEAMEFRIQRQTTSASSGGYFPPHRLGQVVGANRPLLLSAGERSVGETDPSIRLYDIRSFFSARAYNLRYARRVLRRGMQTSW